jgi:hypothetical protein
VGVCPDHDVLRPATNRAADLLIETDSKSLIGPILTLARALDDESVPQRVHIRPPVEEPHLGLISALVVIVTNIHLYMDIIDAVDEKTEGETSILDGLGLPIANGKKQR